MKTFFELRENNQITVGDYTTKHFDMCPSAAKLYSKIKDMTPMVHLVVENMMLHDLFFRLEKQAIAQGAIDDDDLEKADHYAEMIMDNAEQMGLEEEHSYIEDVHMPRFEQLAGMDQEDEMDMSEKTLTAAELKKREEVAKAIKRENPNMPMAKKMAIATATAKKVAEAVEDLSSAGNRRLASIANNPNHPDKAAAKNELNRRKMKNEDVELAELKKSTLASYTQKAAGSLAGNAAAAGYAGGQGQKAHPDVQRFMKNRMKGIQRSAKKLANEETELDEAGAFSYGAKKPRKGSLRDIIAKKAKEYEKSQPVIEPKNQMVGTAKVTKENVELDEGISNISHSRLKFHATKGIPHGSHSNKEIKDEHNRRMRTDPDYVKTKASLGE